MNKLVIDAAERVASTTAQAGIAAAIIEAANLPLWWAPILLAGLTTAKSALASWIGRRDTAALLSAGTDPASRL
ncbi:hypothetical protein [Kitasatospora sp. P5_F3]